MSIINDYIKKVISRLYSDEPKVSIYDERMTCFKKLMELQQNLKTANEEYDKASTDDSKATTLKRIQSYAQEYKKEYEVCETIMKIQ
jgi:hypothetical protein